MVYVLIDGKWHEEQQAPTGEITTACKREIPFGSDWSHEAPTDSLCRKCFPKKKDE